MTRVLHLKESFQQVTLKIWREAASTMVRWEFPSADPPDWLPADAAWFVERSASPGGPFELLHSGMPRESRMYRDDSAPFGHGPQKCLFYRVGWESDGESRVFGYTQEWEREEGGTVFGQAPGEAGQPDHESPAVVRELRKRIHTMLEHYNAESLYLYRARWDQNADTRAVHLASGAVLRSSGQAQLGSTQEGGYYSPLRVLASEGASQGGRNDFLNVVMPHWPPPQKGDLLRATDGEIFQVQQVAPKHMHKHLVHHEVVLFNLDRGHPLSSLPLPEGHRDLSPVPRRQYSRAGNQVAYADLLSAGSMSTASQGKPERADGHGLDD